MTYIRVLAFLIGWALLANSGVAQESGEAHSHLSGNTAQQESQTDPTPGAPPSAFFDTMKTVLTGTWSGQFTNGTFAEPTEWMPVSVEYRGTSRGTAIVEDYLFEGEDEPGMTTVYHQDNGNLRLTHYCGAQNHPRMIARTVDPEQGFVAFDFTDITNLDSQESYHSRQLELKLVADDHIQIQYHGLQRGEIYSQAYDLWRDQD